MKDAYSFCSSEQELDEDYHNMYSTYCKILERIGLVYRVVEADTGLIGGSCSHEFVVLAENGEETLAYCDQCDYAANYENAKYRPCSGLEAEAESPEVMSLMQEVHTPGIKSIEELSEFLDLGKDKILKTMALKDEVSEIYFFLLRSDKELNLSKAERFTGRRLTFMDDGESKELPVGFLGPVSLKTKAKIIADNSVEGMRDFVAGANKKDFHLLNVNIGRDFKIDDWADLSYPDEGDACIKCGGKLRFDKGIEVGHIFKLGKKYSQKLDSNFLDRDSKLKPFIMGCYGIGVSRMLAAAIEQCNDANGIMWPQSISPFDVQLIVTNTSDEKLLKGAERVYGHLLSNNVDVLFDDRPLSAGFKFKDSDLIGIPVRIILGRNFVKNNMIEIEYRDGSVKEEVSADDLGPLIQRMKSR
jgi:prolyl-tRNA synthetase